MRPFAALGLLRAEAELNKEEGDMQIYFSTCWNGFRQWLAHESATGAFLACWAPAFPLLALIVIEILIGRSKELVDLPRKRFRRRGTCFGMSDSAIFLHHHRDTYGVLDRILRGARIRCLQVLAVHAVCLIALFLRPGTVWVGSLAKATGALGAIMALLAVVVAALTFQGVKAELLEWLPDQGHEDQSPYIPRT